MIVKLESLGSYWFVDTVNKNWARTPKTENYRVNPDHAGVGTQLEDLQKFPYVSIEFVDLPPGNFWNERYRLIIIGAVRFVYDGLDRMTPLGNGPWVHAPMTQEQFDNAKELLSGSAPA